MEPEFHNPYKSPIASPQTHLPSPAHGEKLIVLSTFSNPTEAHLFQIELKEHGIDSCIANESTTSLFGASLFGPTSAFSIEVLVRESDSNMALEVKRNWLASNEVTQAEIPEWVCRCGETVDAGFSMCWNCDTPYDSNLHGNDSKDPA